MFVCLSLAGAYILMTSLARFAIAYSYPWDFCRPRMLYFPGLEEIKRLGLFKNAYRNVRKAYSERRTSQSEFCFETSILCNRRSVQRRIMKSAMKKTALQNKLTQNNSSSNGKQTAERLLISSSSTLFQSLKLILDFFKILALETTRNYQEGKRGLYRLETVNNLPQRLQSHVLDLPISRRVVQLQEFIYSNLQISVTKVDK